MPARTYDSTRRRESAAATRAEVLAAATRLFCERGWVGTSVRHIAKEARVSVETVYSSVGSKAAVLRAVIDRSVLGDEDPTPLEDRAEFRAISIGTRAERARTAADLLGSVMPRTAPIVRAIEQGADADPALAEFRREMLLIQREGFRRALMLMAGQEPTAAQLDAAHAVLSERVYLHLTEFAGWSNEEYRVWAADTFLRLFLTEEQP